MREDGSYYAQDGSVWKSPTKTETGFSLGFAVATVNEHVSDPDRVAQLISDALNAWEADEH